MSVIIKGMKMPKHCFECPCSFNVFFCMASGGKAITDASSVHITTDSINISKPTWCPMIDLGTHGDLIDKGNLVEDMLNHSMGCFDDASLREWLKERLVVLEAETED